MMPLTRRTSSAFSGISTLSVVGPINGALKFMGEEVVALSKSLAAGAGVEPKQPPHPVRAGAATLQPAPHIIGEGSLGVVHSDQPNSSGTTRSPKPSAALHSLV